jgi:A/G-specific adenine glycosylase
MKELKDFSVQPFQENLLYWFERNMRDLPWRQDKDPYKVWVSEIMLQQTRVDTVIPYFNRFMEKFPTVNALADAPEDDVLKQWEGLGYYSRARNLQRAVREVKENYGGKVPNDPKQISSLKGVGPYTAGAILSIAYGKREPAVDGNVMRVFSRIFAIEEDIQKQKTRKRFEDLVRELIPTGSASYFNQGIMELGALICTPKSPKCIVCPVEEMCRAKQLGIEQQLPVKEKKKKPRSLNMVAGVLLEDDKVLIRQREGEGLLAKLYEFPNLEWDDVPDETISGHIFEYYGLEAVTSEAYQSVKHVFSHLIWNITVLNLKLVNNRKKNVLEYTLPINSYWVKIEHLDQYAFPVSHQKIKQQLQKKAKT